MTVMLQSAKINNEVQIRDGRSRPSPHGSYLSYFPPSFSKNRQVVSIPR
jgi:hypothetical protein